MSALPAIALAVALAASPAASPTPAPAPVPAPAATPEPTPLDPKTASLEALWTDACRWEVGTNVARVRVARTELVARREATVAYVACAKLDTKDTLVTRALEVVLTGIGRELAAPPLRPCLASASADVRRNAASLLGALGDTGSAPGIAALLADPDARLGALAALGALRVTAVTAPVAALVAGTGSGPPPPERVRMAAAATLGRIGGDAAEHALVDALDRSSPTLVRFAAEHALETLCATDALREALLDPDPARRLHALSALGRSADERARPDLEVALLDPSPVVRGFAAEALAALPETPSTRAALERARSAETDAFARGKLEPAPAAGAP